MEILFPIRLKVLLVVLMCHVLPAAAEMANPNCQLSVRSHTTTYFREGDFMMGGIFHTKALTQYFIQSFKEKSSFRLFRYLLVFIYTTGEINKDPEILPNVTLGYWIYDSCDWAEKSLKGMFSILSGTQQLIPNYSCWNNRKVVGFIGDLSSVSSLCIARLAGIYRPDIGRPGPSFLPLTRADKLPNWSKGPISAAIIVPCKGTFSFTLKGISLSVRKSFEGGNKGYWKTIQNKNILNAIIQKMTSGNKMNFKYHDSSNYYEIVKCFFLEEGGARTVTVGSFDTSKPAGNQLYINSSADLWGPYFPKCPQSQCNEPCMPGYRRSKIEGKPSCCYNCVPCVEGEISNTTDAQSCIKCSEYEKSNTEQDGCIPKNINFLSYKDILGATLSSITILCAVTCACNPGNLYKYRETPIVRANNRYLSCLLLISLMLCFLCTLLFIGRPTQICCLLRQVTFGIVFTISVSSVLAKTLTVIIAFNATKPGSKLKKYVGTQLAIILVIVCSLGEIIISIVWMVSYPPFSETDTLSDPDYIIVQCNEGSGCFFFCIIGYIGSLALLSFIAAFLAKDFPDRFNEAKNITFSMLGFCSVWGAFVPAYLSSKGSRMVAVEIFAILSSSAGLLGCIFIPKCYIIFIRPELNTKDTIVRKR
uniref:G-protein coupled receptors family 3 profile domain-containing protein n=1 Tax=Xenopus tropicalis TaxID=8364 RepID=A0A1B8YAL4_XENTR